jgi:phytoene desaturase
MAGLATAIRLAAGGYKVNVYEANAYPGGKLTQITLGNYRFDAGPSLFTLPNLVDELFEAAGQDPRHYFNYTLLPVTCKYFYEDGTVINGYAEAEKFAQEVAEKTGAKKKDVLAQLQHSSSLYTLLAPLFMHRSLNNFSTWLGKKAWQAYRQLGKLKLGKSLHQANTQQLKAPKAVQLFNRYATYNGSSPYLAPATLQIIPHLEMGIGAFIPKGGMHAITQSLYELAIRLGVKFHFNTPVIQILTENGQAVALQLPGDVVRYDVIVSNADMLPTYRKLLPDHKAPEFLLSQKKSSSALIFYWGIKQKFPQLDLHNIFFSEDYKEEFEHIFSKNSIYHDPTVYLNITSKYEPDDAPDYGENWFTMINVPHDSGQDWGKVIAEARKNILAKLSRMLNTDVESLIEEEDILHPKLIEERTSSAYGALYGNASNSKYAAFLRHSNKSSRIGNLYFCGGSVHPGGGIPLALLSGKITSELIANN